MAFVVACNRIGSDPNANYTGQSAIIDYAGKVLSEAEEKESIISKDLDYEGFLEYRRKLPFLSDLKSDVFRLS